MIGTGTAGPIFTDTINSIGDLIYSAPSGSVNAGTWSVEFIAVTDANGCSADLSGGSMNFTFNVSDPSATTLNETICSPNSYSFNGQSYSTTGTYTATLTNAAGCDSVITLNLTVNYPNSSNVAESICFPSTYNFNGQPLSATGIYLDTLINAAGCDSIVTLNLTVKQPSASSITDTICSGNTYTFNGQSYTASGTYTATLTNAVGCDSVVTLNSSSPLIVTASGYKFLIAS